MFGLSVNLTNIVFGPFRVFHERKHRGDAILEWVVLGVLVIAVVGIVAYSIATNAGTEGTNLASWINGLNVPTSP